MKNFINKNKWTIIIFMALIIGWAVSVSILSSKITEPKSVDTIGITSTVSTTTTETTKVTTKKTTTTTTKATTTTTKATTVVTTTTVPVTTVPANTTISIADDYIPYNGYNTDCSYIYIGNVGYEIPSDIIEYTINECVSYDIPSETLFSMMRYYGDCNLGYNLCGIDDAMIENYIFNHPDLYVMENEEYYIDPTLNVAVASWWFNYCMNYYNENVYDAVSGFYTGIYYHNAGDSCPIADYVTSWQMDTYMCG